LIDEMGGQRPDGTAARRVQHIDEAGIRPKAQHPSIWVDMTGHARIWGTKPQTQYAAE
jgi:hypothetical protein